MVTIINYGLGNIQAFYHIYTQLNLPVKIASSVHDLSEAKKIILPGVGSFDWAMNKLNNSGMRHTLDQLVLEKKIPVLGVCIGMQMLAKSSEEGELPGLNWIDGVVKRFDEQSLSSKNPLPHMGWNSVNPVINHSLLTKLQDPQFYFLHSYYFLPSVIQQKVASTYYGVEFTSVVVRDHIMGVQFHPEKSHRWGIQLLKNFAEL